MPGCRKTKSPSGLKATLNRPKMTVQGEATGVPRPYDSTAIFECLFQSGPIISALGGMIKMKVESTGEVIMIFNDVALEVNIRREQLLRDAEKQRLIREAMPAKSQPRFLQAVRIALAILFIRPV
jgi:hypothetical protein